VILFDLSRKDRSITLNIGPNGNGKTSISKAVMWCLFGENYAKDWEKMVNDLAIDYTKQSNQTEVEVKVTIDIEIDGDIHQIIRSGTYNLASGTKSDKLSVLVNGVVKPNSDDFINAPPLPLTDGFQS
jgi:DNA repair exonuclease SbcCD ATPase subunit